MSATGERAASDRGSTLIEALVVTAITGLIAFIVFPRMQQMLLTMTRTQTAAAVAAQLREARALALEGRGPVAFRVAADGEAYGLTGPTGALREVQAAPGVRVRLSSRAAGGAIVFRADGSSAGGVAQIVGGGRSIDVVVQPGAGDVAFAS